MAKPYVGFQNAFEMQEHAPGPSPLCRVWWGLNFARHPGTCVVCMFVVVLTSRICEGEVCICTRIQLCMSLGGATIGFKVENVDKCMEFAPKAIE